MRHELKKLPNSEIELLVTIESSEIQHFLARAAEDISNEKPIEGFRPGKVPLDVAKKQYGEVHLYERALQKWIAREVPNILDEENIKIVGRPDFQIKKIAPGNPIEFVMKSAVIPEFRLPDVDSIARNVLRGKMPPAVEPAEIDAAVEWIRNERKELKEVDRVAEMGDRVEVSLDIKQGGVPIEGGRSENHPFVIGEGRMVPGFEDQIVGMRAGEEKSFSLAIPEDHHEKRIAGKSLDFNVRVSLVQERLLPELTDAFAASLGHFDSVEKLRKSIEEGILAEKEEKERDRVRIAIMDAITAKTEIALPETLIEPELDKMFLELQERIEAMGMKFDDYLQHLKKSPLELRKEWRPDAERRVKIALVLKVIATEKHIEPSPEEVLGEVTKITARFRSLEDAKKNMDPEALQAYARTLARNERVFRYLESLP